MIRSSFIFYSSYYEAIKNLPEDEQCQMYKIIVEYIIANKQPKKLSKTSKACFLLIKPFLDSSIKRYCANVKNGKKGGRPKKETTPQKKPTETQTKPNNNPSKTQTITQVKPNPKPKQNLNMNMNSNMNINIKENNNIIKEKNINNDDVVDENKKLFDVLLNKINLLQQKHTEQKEMFNYISDLFKRISEIPEFIVKNNVYKSNQILKHFDNLFIGTDEQIIERFVLILEQINQAKNISNRFKYSVSVLYSLATNIADNVDYTPTKQDSFIHNNYTPEQIASCITNLDEFEV